MSFKLIALVMFGSNVAFGWWNGPSFGSTGSSSSSRSSSSSSSSSSFRQSSSSLGYRTYKSLGEYNEVEGNDAAEEGWGVHNGFLCDHNQVPVQTAIVQTRPSGWNLQNSNVGERVFYSASEYKKITGNQVKSSWHVGGNCGLICDGAGHPITIPVSTFQSYVKKNRGHDCSSFFDKTWGEGSYSSKLSQFNKIFSKGASSHSSYKSHTSHGSRPIGWNGGGRVTHYEHHESHTSPIVVRHFESHSSNSGRPIGWNGGTTSGGSSYQRSGSSSYQKSSGSSSSYAASGSQSSSGGLSVSSGGLSVSTGNQGSTGGNWNLKGNVVSDMERSQIDNNSIDMTTFILVISLIITTTSAILIAMCCAYKNNKLKKQTTLIKPKAIVVEN